MDARRENLDILKPVKAMPGEETPAGRIFVLGQHFHEAGITFHTDIKTLSTALAILTSTNVDHKGFHHPCSCNGPPHALIVAKFSAIVLGEMLKNKQTRSIIDDIIQKLNPVTQRFLTENKHANYKKIVEMMALFHDTGRAEDGRDQWHDSNCKNVATNLASLLATTGMASEVHAEIMSEIRSGMENLARFSLKTQEGFLFGAPLGAGDSLHTGNAFNGGLWNFQSSYTSCFSNKYMRVFNQCPDFQETLIKLVKEIQSFLPKPMTDNGGRLAAVLGYFVWDEHFDRHGSESHNIIIKNFSDIIDHEFQQIDRQRFPTMAKYCIKHAANKQDEFIDMVVPRWQAELVTIIQKYNDVRRCHDRSEKYSFFGARVELKEILRCTGAIIEALTGDPTRLHADKKIITEVIRNLDIGQEIREHIKQGNVPDVTTVTQLLDKLASPAVTVQPIL